jgi:hypothetical protein
MMSALTIYPTLIGRSAGTMARHPRTSGTKAIGHEVRGNVRLRKTSHETAASCMSAVGPYRKWLVERDFRCWLPMQGR